MLVCPGGVPGLGLQTCAALGIASWCERGQGVSGVPLLWQKVPVVVLSSWGVVSIICHGRLFLFLVNNLNSSAV